jgi:hypothetical protein
MPAQEVIAYQAARVIPVSGPELTPGCILVAKGRIVSVLAADAVPEGTKVVHLGDGTLFPGMIDAASHWGLRRNSAGTLGPFAIEAHVADALDPEEVPMETLLGAGITAVHSIFMNGNAGNGRSAVVLPGKDGKMQWLQKEGPTQLTLSTGILDSNSAPTSPIGVLEGLRQLQTDPANAWLFELSLPALVRVQTAQEARMALNLTECGFKAQPWILGPAEAARYPQDWAGRIAGVVFDPLPPSLSDSLRKVPAAVAQAGLPIAFSTRAPFTGPTMLRLSAVVAVEGGLARADAWSALTRWPSQLLGVSGEVGALAKGLRADFVYWTGDPLQLSSRVLVVFSGGEIVFDRRGKE